MVWRTSEVSAAACTPFPVTSPDDHDPAFANRPYVVEVTTHQAALERRHVHAGQLVPADLGQLLGEQALLQRPRDRGAFAVEARVLDRYRRPSGNLLGQLLIELIEHAARVRSH
jgi:hypothetical protein